MSRDVVVAVTRRLIVRQLDPGDRGDLLEVYGDREAMRWVDDGGVLSEADCDRWLEITAGNYRDRGYGMFAMADRATPGQVVGFIGLVHPGGQPEAEVKYALRRGWWGRGLATEAVEAVVRYGFADHGLTRIIATTAPENAASHRVLRKAGFREARPRTHPDGTWDRVFVFDWPQPGT
jgi:RimJ/RimL family protein N-acetyltransferase